MRYLFSDKIAKYIYSRIFRLSCDDPAPSTGRAERRDVATPLASRVCGVRIQSRREKTLSLCACALYARAVFAPPRIRACISAGAGQVRCMRRAVLRPIPRHSVDAEREAAAPTQRADHATLRANLAKGDALSSFNVCECWPAPLKLREAAARLPRVPHGPEDDHIYRVQGRPPTLTHTPRAVLVHRVITAHPS